MDDQLGEAYATLGVLSFDFDEFEAAEIAFARAIELSPNYATTYLWYGWMLQILGRYEEALALHLIAAELDPLSSIINVNVGGILLNLGQFDEALARFRETIAKDPGFVQAYNGIANFHRLVSGQIYEAVKWAKKSISIDPGRADYLAELGTDYLHLGDPDNAEYWVNLAISQTSDGFLPNLAMQAYHAFQGNDAAGLVYGRKAFVIEPRVTFIVRYLRDIELRAGRYQDARALYEQSFPELLAESEPGIDGGNVRAAISLPYVLTITGEQDHADLLLNRSLRYLQTTPPDGRDYNTVAKVQIYALQGRTEDALSALRQAVDQNWRFYWWYYFKLDPNLESIRDEPEFQEMLKEVEADMAAQLARLKESESFRSNVADSTPMHRP